MTKAPAMREWFREWFGEEYLALYPHRDEEEARAAVALFHRVASLPDGTRVLDVACGAGRHLRELRRSGVEAVGLDLSAALLRSARSSEPGVLVARGDMRAIPFGPGSFTGVSSFFTSFGYFSDPDDDRAVLREMARVLVPGGFFMLDFLNAERVRRELVPHDVRSTAGMRIEQERAIDGDMVVKRIRIETEEGAVSRFEERVRLYSCDALVERLNRAGLRVEHRFGDYRGGPFGHAAPRLILAGLRDPAPSETGVHG